jgi:UDP-glucose 4-epimerase
LGLLNALRKTDVRFLLLRSSALVYGNATVIPTPETYGPLKPKMAYEINKVKCEKLITAFAAKRRIPAAILRFANIVGGRSYHGVVRDYFERLLAHPTRLRILGDGLQMRSYVHVDDCVSAIEVATKNAHGSVEVYNVASEDAINMHAVVEAVVEELELPLPTIVHTRAHNGGWLGDPRILLPDTQKIRTTGWTTSQQSKQAIRKAVRSMRSRIRRPRRRHAAKYSPTQSHSWQPRLLEKAYWDREFVKLHGGRSGQSSHS